MSTYRFIPSTLDAGNQLVCRAGNVRLPDSTLEDSWKLQIHCKFQGIEMKFIESELNFQNHNTARFIKIPGWKVRSIRNVPEKFFLYMVK